MKLKRGRRRGGEGERQKEKMEKGSKEIRIDCFSARRLRRGMGKGARRLLGWPVSSLFDLGRAVTLCWAGGGLLAASCCQYLAHQDTR